MHVITLLNEKGGVGKTTLATHIGAGLAVRGYRVVIADADPQGHATVSMGERKAPGLYNLLVRGAPFSEVLRRIPPKRFSDPQSKSEGALYLVPSNVETRAIPMMTSDGMIVLKRFSELRNIIDVVIFDTSPTPSLLHASIYMATHSIVYPTECEYLSLDGLNDSMFRREESLPTRERYGMNPIEVMGIVPMKYRSKTVLHQQNYAGLQRAYGLKVWQPLSLRTVWGEASLKRQTVFSYAPGSVAAREAWSIVRRVDKAIS